MIQLTRTDLIVDCRNLQHVCTGIPMEFETVQLLKRVHVRNMFINVAENKFEPLSKGGRFKCLSREHCGDDMDGTTLLHLHTREEGSHVCV